MNSNYILPVSVAAAVHGALLFGFPKSPRVPVPVKEHVIIVCDLMPPYVETPEIVETTAEEPAAKADLTPPPPTSMEPVVLDVPTGATMPLPPIEPPSSGDVRVIVSREKGLVNGRGDGLGVGTIIGREHLDNSPRARFQARPVYPFEVKRTGMAGEVLIEFIVDESGNVLDPKVVKSSDRVFEENTLRAVAKWKFEPGRSGGRIVRFRMVVPVVFNLSE